MPDSPSGLAVRVGTIEARQERQEIHLDRLDDGVGRQAVTAAKHEEQLEDHEDAIKTLAETVNKGIWALVGFAFVVAGSAVGLAITITSHAP